jgi:hypothetical protein
MAAYVDVEYTGVAIFSKVKGRRRAHVGFRGLIHLVNYLIT